MKHLTKGKRQARLNDTSPGLLPAMSDAMSPAATILQMRKKLYRRWPTANEGSWRPILAEAKRVEEADKGLDAVLHGHERLQVGGRRGLQRCGRSQRGTQVARGGVMDGEKKGLARR